MAEPDDLYTLRAQFWLGHYELCLEEAKSVARRPMAPHLKQEREEFTWRAHLALGQHDKVVAAGRSDSSTGECVEIVRAESCIGMHTMTVSSPNGALFSPFSSLTSIHLPLYLAYPWR